MGCKKLLKSQWDGDLGLQYLPSESEETYLTRGLLKRTKSGCPVKPFITYAVNAKLKSGYPRSA